jgi:hypothetical protein
MKRLTSIAHANNLAMAQKNAPTMLNVDLGTDFIIVEECMEYEECQQGRNSRSV